MTCGRQCILTALNEQYCTQPWCYIAIEELAMRALHGWILWATDARAWWFCFPRRLAYLPRLVLRARCGGKTISSFSGIDHHHRRRRRHHHYHFITVQYPTLLSKGWEHHPVHNVQLPLIRISPSTTPSQCYEDIWLLWRTQISSPFCPGETTKTNTNHNLKTFQLKKSSKRRNQLIHEHSVNSERWREIWSSDLNPASSERRYILSLSSLPIDIVLAKRPWISCFPRLCFCGRCRNLEITITTTILKSKYLQNRNAKSLEPTQAQVLSQSIIGRHKVRTQRFRQSDGFRVLVKDLWRYSKR